LLSRFADELQGWESSSFLRAGILCIASAREAYVVQVDDAVLALFAADEVEAAIAHELGHVWVFASAVPPDRAARQRPDT